MALQFRTVTVLPSYKLVSFDIVNLYTNIPVLETIEILKNNLIKTAILNRQQIDELISLLQIVLKQNYFTYDKRFFIQEDGLAMGSPLSGLLAEIYLNFYENKYLLSNCNTFHKAIISYTRYVDDTFVVFDGTYRQINRLLKYMNSVNSKIKFTMEMENNEGINFHDLQNRSFTFNIYRKPTTTDLTIHANSFHPHTQKIVPFNALVNATPLNVILAAYYEMIEMYTDFCIIFTDGSKYSSRVSCSLVVNDEIKVLPCYSPSQCSQLNYMPFN